MIATSPKRAGRSNGRPEPLENGDRLTAPEFLRRYEAMPHIKKAELIEGVVYMGSPVRVGAHGEPDSLIQMWLTTYATHTPGTAAAANCTVQFDIDNVPQPDALLRILPECGGQARVDEHDYLVGAPELVVEVAASSASIDLHAKLHAYRRNGVKEYLVWRTTEKTFDWFVLTEGVYQRQTPGTDGCCHSVTFPGLTLNIPALLDQNGASVLATLNAAIKSQAHRKFAARFAARKGDSRGKTGPGKSKG